MTDLEHFVNNMDSLLKNSMDLVFVKDKQSRFMHSSKGLCNLINLPQKEVIGSIDEELPWSDFANFYKDHDQIVLKGEELDVFEPLPINKDTVLFVKGSKYPIMNKNNESIGLLGKIHIIPATNALSSALSNILSIDKRNTSLSSSTPRSYRLGNYDTNLNLTVREAECLFLLIRGQSAKEIGTILNISYRTVECHVDKIKHKMNVSSRSQLISKAIDMNLLEIFPKGEMLAKICNGNLKDFLLHTKQI